MIHASGESTSGDHARRGFHPLTVTEVRRETEEAVSVAFAVPDELKDRFAFIPGQHLTFRSLIGGEQVRRSYSICSGPNDPALRVAIKLVPGGRFSAWAHRALEPGRSMEAMPPEGSFAHRPDPEAAATYLGVAAGSGITPVLSILKSILAREKQSRFLLLYGNRSTASIMFRETLEDLKDHYIDRLSLVHVLSREQQDIPVLSGRLDGPKVRTLLAGFAALPDLDGAFLCGPGSMIGNVSAALAGAGLPPARVHSERFTTEGEPAPKPRGDAAPGPGFGVATIIVDGIRTDVPVAEGETVLEAAERAGMELPYSCRGGICSTCRARITDGRVEMAVNWSLAPWELEAGYALTCQSRPTTPLVTVDYDQV